MLQNQTFINVLVSLTQLVETMHNICKVWGLNTDHHQQKNLFFLKKKLSIRFKDRLIRGDQSHRPLVGVPFKGRANSVWTCPPKLAAGRIEPEILKGANSKIPSQPLGQPQQQKNSYY